jgi:hypothetical protein
MTLVYIGGFIGLISGGLPGLIVGAGIGYAIGWVVKKSLFGTLQVAQTQLMD